MNPNHHVPTLEHPQSATPSVTILVSPRERFSHTQASLDSIYDNTSYPFKLVYVDGGSPNRIHRYLNDQSQKRQFHLIRTEYYLSPNQARNLGLLVVDTDYVVFIDNDVEVAPNWLTRLVECVQDTQATIVTPLTCIGKPIHQTIHLAGGEARIVLQTKEDIFERRVHEKHYFVNRPVADVQDRLERRQCEFAEFHCMMVRRDIFNRVGPLDEKLLCTREHIDFCMSVSNAGGTIYCEPTSVVTYVNELTFTPSDLEYFMLRWSDEWELKSLKRFRKKWDLGKKSKYFKKRYQRLGHRRHFAFLKPLVRKFTFGKPTPWLEQSLIPLERRLNRWISHRYYSTIGDYQLTAASGSASRSTHIPSTAPEVVAVSENRTTASIATDIAMDKDAGDRPAL
ncbi:MAG: glycosyltransferase [Cyanobacteria bacterium P01_E01_bin.45]